MSSILWFRNDLRLHDNETLHSALKMAKPVLMVYIIDPRQFEVNALKFRKTGRLRFRFLMETLSSLRNACLQKGGNLMIKVGIPEVILPELIDEFDVNHLFYQKEITSEEVAIEAALSERLTALPCEITAVWGLTLYHIDDAPFSPQDTPLTSKAFRLNLTKKAEVRPCFDTPSELPPFPAVKDWGKLPEVSDVGLEHESGLTENSSFVGGEEHALARLDHYTFKTEQLTAYRWTRNRSLGMDYSSKFSPWMALGSLSPRKIYWQIKDYESRIKKNASTWWLVFELVWRDYFKFLAMRFGNLIFSEGGYRQRKVEWKTDKKLFDRWCQGQTGIPFVDAHMRELNQTGFMSNRGRVNCASFLTRDYQIDWRWGAAWFEKQLLDYDVCSNWLNWNTQATEIWYTNPIHQGYKYDKKGDYVRFWLPELRLVPGPEIQAPWILSSEEKLAYEVVNYPLPETIFSKWTRSINTIDKERMEKG